MKKLGINLEVDTKYFGHPFMIEHLNENRAQFFKRHNLNEKNKLIALLPGSEQQEVDKHLKIFIKTITLLKEKFPNLQVIIAKSDNTHIELHDESIKWKKAKKAIIASDVAIVASGTATLECAIEETPFVACYKLSWLTWFLAKYLVK